MRGGHNRKPDAIKVLEDPRGKLRSDRTDPDRLQLDPCQIPRAPKHLADDEQQIWNRLRKILQPLGVVAEADLLNFEVMVILYAIAFRLRTASATDPSDVADAFMKAVKMAEKFGLTPQSRPTVRAVGGRKVEDALDEFMN